MEGLLFHTPDFGSWGQKMMPGEHLRRGSSIACSLWDLHDSSGALVEPVDVTSVYRDPRRPLLAGGEHDGVAAVQGDLHHPAVACTRALICPEHTGGVHSEGRWAHLPGDERRHRSAV